MRKFIVNVRKIHRSFTIPMVILIILKVSLENSAYDSIITPFAAVGMIFMVISGLFIYIDTIKMKMSKKKSK
ncbi:hypothetical protein ACNQFZ_00280 [Schinkia sp. CFF1]